MMTNPAVDKNMPLGHYMATLSKAYVGVLVKRLEYSVVDRYYTVVQALDRDGEPFTQQTLGRFLNVDKVSMVRIIDHLMDRGLIERINNPADRREKFIKLTPAGKHAVQEVSGAAAETNELAMQGFSEKEKEEWYRLLERMNENLGDLPARKIYLNFKRSKK